MTKETGHLVLHLLREMRAKMDKMRSHVATKADLADIRSEMKSSRADVAAGFIEGRRDIAGVKMELGEQIVGLRRAVVEYHTTVVGHGVLISDLEARVRRIESHFELPVSYGH